MAITLLRSINISTTRLSLLLALIYVSCLAVPFPVVADDERPGETNPIAPASRKLQFASNHALAMTINPLSGAGVFSFSDWARSLDLESMQPQFHRYGEVVFDDELTRRGAAGRILSQDSDQIVYAYFTREGSIRVRLRLQDGRLNPQAGQFIDPASKDGALWTRGATQLGVFPDSFDITAGPLGIAVDADDIGHDEIAVCYPVDQAGDSLTVNVTVLDYTNFQANSAVVQTTASASVGISRSLYDISQPSTAFRFPSDSVIACESGDVNGDGVDEVVVAHLSNASTVRVSVFSYVNTLQGSPTLVEVGAYNLQPFGPSGALTASIDVSLAPLSNDINREQIAVASIGPDDFGPLNFFINVQILSSDLNFELNQEPAVFNNLAGTSVLMPDGCPQATPCGMPRVQLVSGLFQYNPGEGFNFDRHQLAVVHNTTNGIRVRTFTVSDDLSTATSLGPSVGISNVGVPDTTNTQARRFSVAAGGFIGNGNVGNPQWSLVITNWESASTNFESGIGRQYLYWLKTQAIGDGALTIAFSRETCDPGNCLPLTGNPNARLPVIDWDPLGESIYLGSPVHFTIENLVSTKFIIYEPPKHMRWVPDPDNPDDPFAGQIQNVSRNSSSRIILSQGESNSFEVEKTNRSDWNAGGSVAVSASQTISGGGEVPFVASVKTETTVKAEVSASYDYESKENQYNSTYGKEEFIRTSATDKDDQLIYNIQLIDIWRYPMLGVELEDDLNAFYDIVFPSTTEEIRVSTAGTSRTWYQPRHENGNVLSYPALSGNSFNPPDCCAPYTYETDQGEVTRELPWFTNEIVTINGNSEGRELNFSMAAGSGETKEFSNTLKASADLTIGNKTKVEVAGGTGGTFEAEVNYNVHGGTTWGESETGRNLTTSSTGINIDLAHGNVSRSYDVAPVFYLADDGTTKAAHAVNLDVSDSVTYFNEIYGRQTDPALNMPQRFVSELLPDESQVWVTNDTQTVNLIRGFFITSPAVDPVTDDNIIFGEAVEAGQEVRLVVRVYNYSFIQFSGLDVKFEAVKYDSVGSQDIGDPVTLSCGESSVVTGIALAGQEMTESICVWDTTEFSPENTGGLQAYRIYVTLDPEDKIQEIYNFTEGPGQNNYGWSIVTIAHPRDTFMFPTPTEDHPLGADVSMSETSLAIEIEGKIESGDIAKLNVGQLASLRACTITDQTQTGYHHIWIWEEDTLTGEQTLIGDQLLQGINADGSSCAWLRNYAPSSPGLKLLRAEVLESQFDALPGNHTDTLYVEVNPTPTPRLRFAWGEAAHVGTDENNGTLSFGASFRLEEENQDFDLSETTLVFDSVLNEVDGAGELLPLEELGGGGQPLTLLPELGATPDSVTFATLSGVEPQVHVEVNHTQKDEIRAQVQVDNSNILSPEDCERTTELLTQMFLINTPDAPLDLSVQEPWVCSKDGMGKVTSLTLRTFPFLE